MTLTMSITVTMPITETIAMRIKLNFGSSHFKFFTINIIELVKFH